MNPAPSPIRSRINRMLCTAAALVVFASMASAAAAETIIDTKFTTDGDPLGWRNDYFTSNNLTMTVANGNLTVNGGTGYRGIYHTFSGSSIPTGKVVLGVGEQLKLNLNLRWNQDPLTVLQFGFLAYDGTGSAPGGIGYSTGYYSTVSIPLATTAELTIRRANGNNTSSILDLESASPQFATNRDQWYSVSFSISRIDTNTFQLKTIFGDHTVESIIEATEAAPFLNSFGSLYLGSGNAQPPRFSIDNVSVTYGQIPEASSLALLTGTAALLAVAAARIRR